MDAIFHQFYNSSNNDDCTCLVYESQSGNIRMDTATASDNVTSEIVTFADGDAGWTVDVGSSRDATMSLADNTNSDSLGSFLKRPVAVAPLNWIVGAPFIYTFNPWRIFCIDAYVKDKIDNFELLRCNLCVKFTINGTPFHYGRLLASYNPLPTFDDVTVERNFFDQDLIAASQKPHVFLNPTTCEGGTLKLPFFFRNNYMSLTDKDYDDMGEIVIKSFDVLKHANAGNNPVTVRAYIWAEDVVLTVPTTLVSQSGKAKKLGSDEYGQDIISKPASALAKAAGLLGNAPIIGPYARATQMVANGVGDLAKLFGYSRPPLLQNESVVQPRYAGNMANVDAPENILKLSLDSKAEVTIDPRVTGLTPQDEMNILSLLTKESYLTSFTFSTINALDDMLWQCRVNPSLHGILGNEIHPTAMAYFMNYFQYWQGSIKFRFQIVKAKHHQGRIMVRYDPNSFGDSNINYNINYSRVVDISEEEDFEVIVGWGQKEPFLTVPAMDTANNWFNSALPRLSTDSTGQHNGVIEVNVVNELVVPKDLGTISINVYVSMCDDAKYAVPVQDRLNLYHLWPEPEQQVEASAQLLSEEMLESQSGVESMNDSGTGSEDKPGGAMQMSMLTKPAQEADHTMSVFFGEMPTSLRELCKRYTLTRSWRFPKSNFVVDYAELVTKDLPYHTGYDPQGLDTSAIAGKVTCGFTSPISYFLPAFAAYRGAMRHKYITVTNRDGFTNCSMVTRRGFQGQSNGVVTLESFSVLQSKSLALAGPSNSNAGIALQNTLQNNVIQSELPFYNPGRFAHARLISAQDLNCPSHSIGLLGRYTTEASDSIVSNFVAAGEDFSLYFYTGAPILYKYQLTANS